MHTDSPGSLPLRPGDLHILKTVEENFYRSYTYKHAYELEIFLTKNQLRFKTFLNSLANNTKAESRHVIRNHYF